MQKANRIGGEFFVCLLCAISLCHTVRRYLVSSVANWQNHPGPNLSGKVIGPEYEKHTLPTGADRSWLLTPVGRCAFRWMATFDTIYKHVCTHTTAHAHTSTRVITSLQVAYDGLRLITDWLMVSVCSNCECRTHFCDGLSDPICYNLRSCCAFAAIIVIAMTTSATMGMETGMERACSGEIVRLAD